MNRGAVGINREIDVLSQGLTWNFVMSRAKYLSVTRVTKEALVRQRERVSETDDGNEDQSKN